VLGGSAAILAAACGGAGTGSAPTDASVEAEGAVDDAGERDATADADASADDGRAPDAGDAGAFDAGDAGAFDAGDAGAFDAGVDGGGQGDASREGGLEAGAHCSDDSQCAAGLKCCYPCGIMGCSNECITPTASGTCPLFP
jgi:hypothetical protein